MDIDTDNDRLSHLSTVGDSLSVQVDHIDCLDNHSNDLDTLVPLACIGRTHQMILNSPLDTDCS